MTQAKFTEVFCDVDDALRNQLALFVRKGEADAYSGKTNGLSIIQRIERDAQSYGSEDEIIKMYEVLESCLRSVKLQTEFSELFQLRIDSYEYPPRSAEIGRWLDVNRFSPPLLASPTKGKTKRKKLIPRDPIARMTGLMSFAGSGEVTEIEEEIEVINGYELRKSFPFKSIELYAESRRPNLYIYRLVICPIPSMNRMQLFYGIFCYERTSWDEQRLADYTEWVPASVPVKESAAVQPLMTKIIADFEQFIEASIAKKWGDVGNEEATADRD